MNIAYRWLLKCNNANKSAKAETTYLDFPKWKHLGSIVLIQSTAIWEPPLFTTSYSATLWFSQNTKGFRDWKCCPLLPERRITDRQVVCKKPKIEERGAKSLRTTCCPICSLSNSISFSFSIPVNTVWLKNLQYYKAWGRKHLTRLLNLEGKGNRKVMFALSAFLLLKFTTAPFQADLISPKLDFDFPAFPFRGWALVYTYHLCWVAERLPLCPNRNISCDIVRVPNLYFGIQYSWGTWLAVTWLFCTYFLIAAKAASTMGNCDRQSCKVFASAATAATGEVICNYLYSNPRRTVIDYCY